MYVLVYFLAKFLPEAFLSRMSINMHQPLRCWPLELSKTPTDNHLDCMLRSVVTCSTLSHIHSYAYAQRHTNTLKSHSRCQQHNVTITWIWLIYCFWQNQWTFSVFFTLILQMVDRFKSIFKTHKEQKLWNLWFLIVQESRFIFILLITISTLDD